MSIVVKQGDITKTSAPVIVNAGNTSLWLGTGVAGAIRTQGGPTIQEELDRITECRTPRRWIESDSGSKLPDRQVPCDLGDVVVTHAGNLHARYVFHAAVMDSQGKNRGVTNLNIIRVATANCMLMARQLSVNGLAFPIFGTGVGGMDIAEVAKVMISTIHTYRIPDVRVRLYAYDQAAEVVVKQVLTAFNLLHKE